jgi:formylglycine-generating enzyme required for sulfatase activity
VVRWKTVNVQRARRQIPQVAALAEAGNYAAAYDLAVAVQRYLPGDPTITRVMPAISDSISVTTEPSGAAVYLTRFTDGTPAPRERIGTSPLTNARIARGQYVVSVEKDGYTSIERTVSGVTIRAGALIITPPPIRIQQRLMPAADVPARMVFVPGGDYRLVAWSRPTDRRVRLNDYFVDKYEVSNQEYKEFINAGGYVKRDYWTHPFIKDGRTLSWDEAVALLVDRTGLPGPRSWSTQNFPEGKADHPVTGVTWYEAEAYARFRGKQLATIYQWEKAARNGYVGQAGVAAMPWGAFYPGDSLKERANFGSAVWPTTSAAFGMSAFGAYNMAGNVAEWTLNDSSDGFLATGGAWGDPTYTFSQFGGRPGFFSSEKLGFRCARVADGSAGDQGGFRIELAQEVPTFKPASPQEFVALAAAYRYDKTPLDARIEQTTDTPAWKRERISFNGANGARAIAYLYLPTNAPRPLQVIHLIPAGDVASGFRSLPDAMDDRMAPFVKAGRAAFAVVLEGYIERLRPAGFVPPDPGTVEFKEMIVSRVTELRRGLDYLETRPDIDATRIAALAPSAGSALGLILGAVEPRIPRLCVRRRRTHGHERGDQCRGQPGELRAVHPRAEADPAGSLRRGHAASHTNRAPAQAPGGTETADALRRRARAVGRSGHEQHQRLAGATPGTRVSLIVGGQTPRYFLRCPIAQRCALDRMNNWPSDTRPYSTIRRARVVQRIRREQFELRSRPEHLRRPGGFARDVDLAVGECR